MPAFITRDVSARFYFERHVATVSRKAVSRGGEPSEAADDTARRTPAVEYEHRPPTANTLLVPEEE